MRGSPKRRIECSGVVTEQLRPNTLFGSVGLYGLSTIVEYLMPNPLYTYLLNT